VQAIVFVVDAADFDNLATSARELHALLDKPSLAGVPLLVLGNKNDLPGALGTQDLIERINLQVRGGRGRGCGCGWRSGVRACFAEGSAVGSSGCLLCTRPARARSLVHGGSVNWAGHRWLRVLLMPGQCKAHVAGLQVVACCALVGCASSRPARPPAPPKTNLLAAELPGRRPAARAALPPS
jgi:hypothetical protein